MVWSRAIPSQSSKKYGAVTLASARSVPDAGRAAGKLGVKTISDQVAASSANSDANPRDCVSGITQK